MDPKPEIEVMVEKRYDPDKDRPVVSIATLTCPNKRAECAMFLSGQLMHAFNVAAVPPRLFTPEEIAERACDTADALWAQIKARGWLFDVPSDSQARAFLAALDKSPGERLFDKFQEGAGAAASAAAAALAEAKKEGGE